ncbi:MAG: HD domain-containing protein [Fimbriimonadaceae bacterium]|nr:HD domain-containing protein [Fimbriimonadaceae bacterium]
MVLESKPRAAWSPLIWVTFLLGILGLAAAVLQLASGLAAGRERQQLSLHRLGEFAALVSSSDSTGTQDASALLDKFRSVRGLDRVVLIQNSLGRYGFEAGPVTLRVGAPPLPVSDQFRPIDAPDFVRRSIEHGDIQSDLASRSVIVPILREGSPRSYLILQASGDAESAHVMAQWTGFGWACSLIILGVLTAVGTMLQLRTRLAGGSAIHIPRTVFIMELGILALMIGGFTLAVFSTVRVGQAGMAQIRDTERILVLEHGIQLLRSSDRVESAKRIRRLGHDLQKLDLGPEAAVLIGLTDGTAGRTEAAVRSAATLLTGRLESILSQKRFTTAELQSDSRRALFGVALALAGLLASTLLVRKTTFRNEQLALASGEAGRLRDRLTSVLETMPIGLFTFSKTGFGYANQAWQDLSEDAVPTADRLTFVHGDDRAHLQERLESVLSEGVPSEASVRVQRPGGPTRYLQILIRPLPSDSGEREILAYGVETTEMVQARLNLQAKSQEIEIKNRLLGSALEDLETNLESIVRCLVRAVEAKDPYTAGHSERVMSYSLRIGQELGLGPYEMRVLELGTLVHDVGKIGIPDAILTKPGALSNEEFDEIKKHPEFGVRILENINLFQECMPIVRWHHERMNGTGYPDRLQGDEIPFLVRIAAVADVFDAMTSNRAYRVGIDPKVTLRIMAQDVVDGKLDRISFEALQTSVLRDGVIAQTIQPSVIPMDDLRAA